MITFSRDGCRVVCKVETTIGYTFDLSYNAGTEWAACLLLQHLRDRFGDQIRATREAEYMQGWKDARAHKRPKKTWWRCVLGRDAS